MKHNKQIGIDMSIKFYGRHCCLYSNKFIVFFCLLVNLCPHYLQLPERKIQDPNGSFYRISQNIHSIDFCILAIIAATYSILSQYLLNHFVTILLNILSVWFLQNIRKCERQMIMVPFVKCIFSFLCVQRKKNASNTEENYGIKARHFSEIIWH